MTRPWALDLCCGKGGWSKGLLDAGWNVIGVDIEDMGGYPADANLVLADVRKFSLKAGVKIGLVTASPPCQEFSYRSFPFKPCVYLRDNVPPDKSIWRACERIAREVGAPLIIENVKGAARYMGNPQAKYGPYWLWGDVPLLLPVGKGVHKGFTNTGGNNQFRGNVNAYKKTEFAQARDRKNEFNRGESAKTGSKSKASKEWSAKIAMIPYPLSRYIGDYFMKEYRESLPGKPSRKRSRNMKQKGGDDES